MLSLHSLQSGYEAEGIAVNVQLPSGSHLVLTGRSGSGKTSLLRVIAGLEPAKQGRVLLGERPVTMEQLRWWREQIYYCPQHAIIGDGADVMTIAEALLLPWQLNATSKGVPERHALNTVLEKVGLALTLEDETAALSGGERYRLMVARGLLMAREIWLLDEPTAALDRQNSQWLAELFQAHTGYCISVSHDPTWIASATHQFNVDTGCLCEKHNDADSMRAMSHSQRGEG
ncbi:ABC transporter ATP-binding protein [Thaumasiovibrio subtropicus]|uniref:ABC transporter ATP-binding protein n=1 Tax=Thaumasiovibrio subtropicus TaxID=1891207 RepID=UPI000B354EFA|nr:ATP-binding cassette domain-containing protein [Thaumasiovibrio subtropicus]